MTKLRRSGKKERDIGTYEHSDKERSNNPPVGLVTPRTDQDTVGTEYFHDPHIDPHLSWCGKEEHTSFEVPTVSLHVHGRIDPLTIVDAVRRRTGKGKQLSLFATPEENPPLRQAIEFYKHLHSWSNRLIAGDSLLVMNSLIEKEGLAGRVQMVYMDPPYGIRYGSNFQPFVNLRAVRDRRDEHLTQEPETIRAFRDTWELGIHSYLSYLRDRLLLVRELLHKSGSCFVQIGNENVHLVRNIMDEVFGRENFMSLISFRTKIPLNAAHVPNIADYLVWYGREKKQIKFHKLFVPRDYGEGTPFSSAKLADGAEVSARHVPKEQRRSAKYYSLVDLMATGYTESCHFEFEFEGRRARPNPTTSWKTTRQGMDKLIVAKRLRWTRSVPRYVFWADDYPVMEITNLWTDTQGASGKSYAVQTAAKIIQRCLLMTTDPGDLVLDPTCGSGTTAWVAEQWGRRWITCDTSRVAITLSKQRLMTACFDYYQLARADEGVASGFMYKTVPHVTLGSVANNPEIRIGMTQEQIDAAIASHAPQVTLYDRPHIDRSKVRVTGPFTVEAVPAPTVLSLDELETGPSLPADASIARMGPTVRQGEWHDELLKTGIRGKAGQRVAFTRLESLPGAKWLHAEGELPRGDISKEGLTGSGELRVVVSFGPDHAPMEQRQVALAIEESFSLVPEPKVIVFAAFQFDPEASKDIDETNWPGVTLLKAQMNADLLTEDLKKKRASNESFWLIGQPDVELERVAEGEDEGKFFIRIKGFDYYNTKTGSVESGGPDQIALWMLDPDYDGRSLFPHQVFFPMAGTKGGWAKLGRSLRAEIDAKRMESYRGTVSLPFESGERGRAAVKIVDNRGVESLRIVELE